MRHAKTAIHPVVETLGDVGRARAHTVVVRPQTWWEIALDPRGLHVLGQSSCLRVCQWFYCGWNTEPRPSECHHELRQCWHGHQLPDPTANWVGFVFVLGSEAFLLDTAVYSLAKVEGTSLHTCFWKDLTKRLNCCLLEVYQEGMLADVQRFYQRSIPLDCQLSHGVQRTELNQTLPNGNAKWRCLVWSFFLHTTSGVRR